MPSARSLAPRIATIRRLAAAGLLALTLAACGDDEKTYTWALDPFVAQRFKTAAVDRSARKEAVR